MKNTIWRTIYLVVLTLVTICVVVVSSVARLGKWAWDIGSSIGSGFHFNGFQFVIADATSEEWTDMDEFQSIELDVDIAGVVITVGDEYKLSMKYPKEVMPTFEVKDGVLTIKQTNDKNLKPKGNSIEIEIPKDKNLESISGEISAGSIQMKDLEVKNFNLNVDAGNVELDNVWGDNFKVTASAGNVELEDIKVKTLVLDADMGRIEVKDATFTSATVSADLGDVKLKDITCTKADVKANLGSVIIKGTFDELEASADMGSVTVNAKNADCKVDLSASMGSVSFNGKNQGNHYVQ